MFLNAQLACIPPQNITSDSGMFTFDLTGWHEAFVIISLSFAGGLNIDSILVEESDVEIEVSGESYEVLTELSGDTLPTIEHLHNQCIAIDLSKRSKPWIRITVDASSANVDVSAVVVGEHNSFEFTTQE